MKQALSLLVIIVFVFCGCKPSPLRKATVVVYDRLNKTDTLILLFDTRLYISDNDLYDGGGSRLALDVFRFSVIQSDTLKIQTK